VNEKEPSSGDIIIVGNTTALVINVRPRRAAEPRQKIDIYAEDRFINGFPYDSSLDTLIRVFD